MGFIRESHLSPVRRPSFHQLVYDPVLVPSPAIFIHFRRSIPCFHIFQAIPFCKRLCPSSTASCLFSSSNPCRFISTAHTSVQLHKAMRYNQVFPITHIFQVRRNHRTNWSASKVWYRYGHLYFCIQGRHYSRWFRNGCSINFPRCLSFARILVRPLSSSITYISSGPSGHLAARVGYDCIEQLLSWPVPKVANNGPEQTKVSHSRYYFFQYLSRYVFWVLNNSVLHCLSFSVTAIPPISVMMKLASGNNLGSAYIFPQNFPGGKCQLFRVALGSVPSLSATISPHPFCFYA